MASTAKKTIFLKGDLDFDLDSDDEYAMTPDEAKSYQKQVIESEGFDVDEVFSLVIGQIHRIDLYEDVEDPNTDLCLSLTKTAIDMYNQSEHKDIEGELEYDQLLMATHQSVCGFMFRLTFNAKNLAKEGKSFPYQAIVLMGLKNEPEVLSFRPKPSGSDKTWFWDTRRRGK